MQGYVKHVLLNLDHSLKQPPAQLKAALNCSGPTREVHTCSYTSVHVQTYTVYTVHACIHMQRHTLRDTHWKGLLGTFPAKKEITSLEPWEGYIQNEKQADGKGGGGRERHNVTWESLCDAHLFSCKLIGPLMISFHLGCTVEQSKRP